MHSTMCENITRMVITIATGGADEQSIRATIRAGANAIVWTPPSSAELFRDVMKNYREGKPHP